MNTIKIPEPKLYDLFVKKKELYKRMKVVNTLLEQVDSFNIMNKRVNMAIYNNIKNGQFEMCLIADLKFESYKFDLIKKVEHKLVRKYIEDNYEINNVNFLQTNWVLKELSEKGWNIYYENKELRVNRIIHLYTQIVITPQELNKTKVISNKNIIPFNGLPIMDDLKKEYNELTIENEKNEKEIREML
jgi:hypothetical protein